MSSCNGLGRRAEAAGMGGPVAFAGPLLHTSELTDLTSFRGRRVLVVGAGSSGIDIAGVLSVPAQP